MTLDGTNTWILLEPGAGSAVVVDPGPEHEGHLRAVIEVVHDLGAVVGLTLLTHAHPDHGEGAARFAELTRAPVLATADGSLRDGQVVRHDGLEVEVIATAGHSSDSVCFLVRADAALLTGDTVLGRGTTVVAWPDGALAPYLTSLARIGTLIDHGVVRTVLPGHGPVVADPGVWVRWYLDHRRERLDQVRAAVGEGAQGARAVVERVYADVPRGLWDAAELSVRAQLDYLELSSQPDPPR
jgi:glyoxylase-like metal-dependent hydrolase (beta-lactamase superfamily II)